MLKRLYFMLGERSINVPWLTGLLIFNVRALGWWPSRFSDKRRAYTNESGQIGSQPDTTNLNDLSLNFYTRLIVQNRYDFVIELGAYSLERSRWLAEHFPDVRVHALDITKDFAEQRDFDRVSVGPNNLHHIQQIAQGRGLVVASGALCCYTAVELARLFALLHSLQLDIALNEPNTVGELSLDRSIKRTHQSYYHPYVAMLTKAGFTLPDNNGHQIRDCWSEYAETRTFLFARPSSP